jgi:nucleotide-binding universal stress UspA family protein
MTMQGKYLSKILVAIDGSTPSMHAADYAISIAIKYGSQLIALYVIDPYRYPYLPSSIILAPTFGSEKYMEERNIAEEWMDTIKEKYNQENKHNINTKYLKAEIIEGVMSVSATIIEYTESENVGLIVIGGRCRTSFKKLLLGSISSDVIKYARCPVLVIR